MLLSLSSHCYHVVLLLLSHCRHVIFIIALWPWHCGHHIIAFVVASSLCCCHRCIVTVSPSSLLSHCHLHCRCHVITFIVTVTSSPSSSLLHRHLHRCCCIITFIIASSRCHLHHHIVASSVLSHCQCCCCCRIVAVSVASLLLLPCRYGHVRMWKGSVSEGHSPPGECSMLSLSSFVWLVTDVLSCLDVITMYGAGTLLASERRQTFLPDRDGQTSVERI